MSFSSPVFLWYFLPAVLVAYWLVRPAGRNVIMTGFSLLFYAWGGGRFVFLLALSAVMNYGFGIAIEALRERGRLAGSRRILTGAIVANMALLAYWKYAAFLFEQVDGISRALGFGAVGALDIVLPIGISFFTFHGVSYVVDVSRGTNRALRNPVDFALYMTLFPQLVAGPIVRFHEIAEQLRSFPSRSQRLDDFASGFPRFALGLSKKVLIADVMGPAVDAAFLVGNTDLTTVTAWFAALGYSVQIYFDFSGYSDMAIGLGKMFGLTLPENFNRPYSSVSLTDFWRRWHLSLSGWFRDYVYIPLGGSRAGNARTYRNLVTVFLLTGLWHGAAWTFVAWGAYHGLLLVVERVTGIAHKDAVWLHWPRRVVVFQLVTLGWVLFRSVDLAHAVSLVSGMFRFDGLPLASSVSTLMTTQVQAALVVGLATAFLPRSLVLGRALASSTSRRVKVLRFATLVTVPYSAVLVASGTFSPFLYYQF